MKWHFSFPTINVNVAELPSHDAAMARVGAMANPEMDLVGDNISNEVGVSVDFEFEQVVGKPEVDQDYEVCQSDAFLTRQLSVGVQAK